jgi:hypothetical protein
LDTEALFINFLRTEQSEGDALDVDLFMLLLNWSFDLLCIIILYLSFFLFLFKILEPTLTAGVG